MKIVVIGGTGLIGTQMLGRLRELGHDAVAASPSRGVNALTGEGLAAALEGAQVVVDVANSPSFEDAAVLQFFQTSSRNLLAAEIAAGVQHHVALSVVGVDRTRDSGYFLAKRAQEEIIEAGPIPYTIVRATQFFEFLGTIAQGGTVGDSVRLSPALFQPMAAKDVANLMVEATLEAPLNGIVEIAGPEPVPMDQTIAKYLKAQGDVRTVITDPEARYFGLHMDDDAITPGENPRLGTILLEEWLEGISAK